MKALVTGGTGFIGSNLAIELDNQGYEVIVTGNESEQKLPQGRRVLYPTLMGINWDILDGIDIVFHQAAMNDTTNLDSQVMIHANYLTTVEFFKKMIDRGCKNIVYASSTAVYGDAPAPYKEGMVKNPLNPYAESKLCVDVAVSDLSKENPDVKFVGLRYCNVYGPRESHKGKKASMIYQLAKQMTYGSPRIFEDGSQKRDHIYVKDVVEANILASKAKESCIVNCGSGSATTFNRLVEIINEVMGTSRPIEYIPNPYADRYQNHTECDMSLAKEKIGFVPRYSIEQGIKDYFDSGFLV